MSKADKKIDLATAKLWTKNYRDNKSSLDASVRCNAFLVPSEDLVGSLAEIQSQTGEKFIRAYVGLDMSKTPHVEKLIVVGTQPEVQKDGSIIYRDLIAGYNGLDVTSGKGSIWDFSQPCPPGCDPNSPIA